MGELLVGADLSTVGSSSPSRSPVAEPINPVDVFLGVAMSNVAEPIIREVIAEHSPQPAAPKSVTVSGQTGTV